MNLRRYGRLFAAFAAFVLLAQPASADVPVPANGKIAPDPAVKRGTLPNGLRYAVMENKTPAGLVSIRLALDVGSYQEEESERGFAHFIEHLAFRSTRQTPGGSWDNKFAALGIAMGRDQNASTGLKATIYRVDLPAGGIASARTLLDWMRGAADGILFDPSDIRSELGAVIAERQARDSPLARAQAESAAFQGRGLRSMDRDPIGTESALRAATPASLRAFYDRWYRPERAMLVVIGDAPAAELEKAVAELFGSWAARGPAGVDPAPPARPIERPLEAMVQSDPAIPTGVSACRISPPDLDRSSQLLRLRRDVYSILWTNILDKRLAHLAASENSVLLGGGAAVNRDIPDALLSCLALAPTNERWREALDAGQNEFRRFAADGPTAREVETATEELRSRLRAQLRQAETRHSSAIADQIVESELEGRVFQDPREAMRAFEIVVNGLSPEDLRKAFAEDWKGAGPLLVATGPAPPSKEDLLAAWQANENGARPSAYADRDDSEWLYTRFGKKGKVKARQDFTDPAFTRFTFGNGVVLNFKRTSLQSQDAQIRVRFGWGERALDPGSRLTTTLAAGLFPMGGLGRMDYEQIASALKNTTWGFSLSVDTDAYTLSSGTLAEQVPQQMQLLAAYMTDPGFRSLMDDKLPTAVDYMYRSFRTSPNMVALQTLESALYPDKPSLPPLEVMAGYRVDDFEKLLRPVLTGAPIEVTVVGDIDEESAIDAVATTFGALKKRDPLPEPRGEGPFRRFPAELPGPLVSRHQGPSEKAAAVLMWPLYVATPERRMEEYAILLSAAIFETRLLRKVRVEMGKVYSPSVAAVTPDDSDQGYYGVSLEGTPADIGSLVAAAREIARDLAAGKISQEELDAARDPMIAARLQAQNRNEAWAGVLSAQRTHPEAVDELLAYERQLRAISVEDVRRAAATWIARDPLVSTALPAAIGAAGH